MTSTYSACAEQVRRLHTAVRQLESHTRLLQVAPLSGRDWFEVLDRKLLPQMSDDAFLVVAVVGGTNIGKSVIFNHLAGCSASAVSPFASGTKHPVCLVPPGFERQHNLAAIFRGFELHSWSNPQAALEEHSEHRLFWRTNDSTPSNLLILDTPDIDGDVRVNWERADNIRRCADVLVAVLTQQKYNDAAVKQFFRKAADEDKAVLVVFNQVLLPDDETYWPMWLKTFCSETGVRPEFVYVAPSDRAAANEGRLPFFPREWRTGSVNPLVGETIGLGSTEGLTPPVRQTTQETDSHSLKHDLSAMHFRAIKLRTLRGALRSVLHSETGVPAYLAEIASRSGEFQIATELLATHQLAETAEWQPLPNAVVVQEVRTWWQRQRTGWSKHVHDTYNAFGRLIVKPFSALRDHWQPDRTPPLEHYRQAEWQTILGTVERVYERLHWFAELGNPLLQPRLERLLGGRSRVELLQLLKSRHDLTDLEHEIHDLVAAELSAFRDQSPQMFELMKWLDRGAAAVRPVTSICLFFTGFGPAGQAVHHVAASAALQFAVDCAGGTVSAVAGETAISHTAATGVGMFEAWFRRLHARFSAHRASWLARMLKEHLFGDLPDELQTAVAVPQTEAFVAVKATINELSDALVHATDQTSFIRSLK